MDQTHCRKGLELGTPATYRILVQGYLDERYSDRLGGLTITPADADEGPVVTTLHGRLCDQADLLGVLNSLYGMLHLPLLSVECVEVGEEVA